MKKNCIFVTGGLGSGKSRVLGILKDSFRARVIEADRVAKELEEPGEPGYDRLAAAFGTSVLGPGGVLDRGKLAELIFSDKKALETVNAILHPMTWERIREAVQRSTESLVVVEAALLAEPSADIYDETWYVYTLRETRIRRLMESRGYSRDKALRIMGSQPSENQYRAAADWVLDNNGTIKDLEEQLETRLGTPPDRR